MNYLFTLLFFFTAGWSNLLSVPQVSVKATAFANMNDYQMEGYLDAQRKKGTQVRIDPSSAQAVVVQRIESRTDLTEPAGALSGREAPEVHGQKEGAPDQPTTKTPSTTGTGSGTSSSSSGTEPVTTPQTPTKPTTPEMPPVIPQAPDGAPEAPPLDILTPTKPVKPGKTEKEKKAEQEKSEKEKAQVSKAEQEKSDKLLLAVLKSVAMQFAIPRDAYAKSTRNAFEMLTDKKGDYKRDGEQLLKSMEEYIATALTLPTNQREQDAWLLSAYTQLVQHGEKAEIVAGMRDILANQGLFDQRLITPVVLDQIVTFTISIIASQRTIPAQIGMADKIESDGIMLEVVEAIVKNPEIQKKSNELALLEDKKRQIEDDVKKVDAIIQKMTPMQLESLRVIVTRSKTVRPKESSKDKSAREQQGHEAQGKIDDYDRAVAQKKDLSEKKKTINNDIGTYKYTFLMSVTHDYFMQLFQQMNYLRLHPDFFRFDLLLGQAAEAALSKGAASAHPFLTLALSNDRSWFIGGKSIHASIQKALFSPDEWNAFIKQDNYNTALMLIAEYHAQQLKIMQGSSTVYDFLQQGISALKNERQSVKKIIDLISVAEQELGGPVVLDTLKKEFKRFPLDDKAIIRILQQTLMPATGIDAAEKQRNEKVMLDGFDALSKKITTIVNIYNKEQKQASEILNIVRQAHDQMVKYQDQVKQAEKDKRTIERFYVGKDLISAIEKQLKKLTNAQQRAFKGIARTAKTVYGALSTLVGAEELQGIVKLPDADKAAKVAIAQNFYYWIEPYGDLLDLFEKAPTSLTSKSAAENITNLLDMLTALNNTVAYRGLLTNMRSNLAAYRMVEVLHDIEKLVAKADVGVEKSPEYKTLMKKTVQFIVPIMETVIIDELKELDRGAFIFEELPLEGTRLNPTDRRRNAAIYRSWKGLFTQIIAELEKSKDNPVDIEKLAQMLERARVAMIGSVPQEQVDLVTKPVTEFIASTQRKLTDLLDAYIAVGMVFVRATQPSEPTDKSGIPQAPPMDGDGIPEPPPFDV